MPRIFDHLLREMHRRSEAADANEELKFACHVSMLEVYKETVMDLFHPEACNLDIREDALHGTYVDGLSKQEVTSRAAIQSCLTRSRPNWCDAVVD